MRPVTRPPRARRHRAPASSGGRPPGRSPAGSAVGLLVGVVALVVLVGAGALPMSPGTPAGASGAALVATGPALPPLTGDLTGVHDPMGVVDGGTWYVFSTGGRLRLHTSADGVHWTDRGAVLRDGLPAWLTATIPGGEDLWAPDVHRIGDRWFLYYARSQFGTSNSVIGLATNTTLDPADPAYVWVDQGEVLRSHPGDGMNAIDPALVVDEHGEPWLAWGSFWDGIFVQRVDPATGKLTDPGSRTNLARRDPTFLGVEGADLVRADGAWWLFSSWGSCCKGVASTYSIRVSRAASLTGPYVDAAGVPLLDGGGTLVLGSHGSMFGPGHGTAVEVGGRRLLVHHFYDGDADGIATLAVDPLVWAPDGWPLVLDRSFVADAAPNAAVAAGVWHVTGERENRPAHVPDDVTLTLLPDGTVRGGGTWRVDGQLLRIEGVPRWAGTDNAQVRDWWLLVDSTTGASPQAIGRDDRTALVTALRTADAPATSTTTAPVTTTAAPTTTAPGTSSVPAPAAAPVVATPALAG